MKVNPILVEAISFNPSKNTQLMSIENLCEEALCRNILLPQYQTGLRWVLHKNVDLLNYQLSGKAPVAAISMNEIREDYGVSHVSFIDREPIVDIARKKSMTDGQQRLTCNLKAYTNHPSFSSIVLDLRRGQFTINDEEIKKHQIPVGILMNKNYSEFENYAKKRKMLFDNWQTLVMARQKLLGYNYVVNIGVNMNKQEQLEWFEKLNNAGSKVPGLQIKLTLLTKDDIDIQVEYTTPFLELLKENGYESLLPMKNTEFSIPVAVLNPGVEVILKKEHTLNWSVMPSDVKVKDLCNLAPKEIRSVFNNTLESLKKAINFYKDYELSIDRIDYLTNLTGFFVKYGDKELTDTHIMNLTKWHNEVDFANKSNTDRRKIFDNLLKLI